MIEDIEREKKKRDIAIEATNYLPVSIRLISSYYKENP